MRAVDRPLTKRGQCHGFTIENQPICDEREPHEQMSARQLAKKS